MADDIVDLLQINIEKAKRNLPLETINAINAVDWKAAILGLRGKYGYTFEQLGDLELETELLLCGLVNSEDYPKELSKQMGISKSAADELVNEMNNVVFKRIRGELIKNTERKKIFANKSNFSPLLEGEGTGGGNSEFKSPPRSDLDRSTPPPQGGEEIPPPSTDTSILNTAGIEIVENKNLLPEVVPANVPTNINREDILKKIEKPEAVHPILAQKLSGSVQIPTIKTEHTLDNITKTPVPQSPSVKPKIPNVDPYREMPE